MLRVGNPESSAGEYPEGDTVIIEANYKAPEMSYNIFFFCYFSLAVEISLGNAWGKLLNKEWIPHRVVPVPPHPPLGFVFCIGFW